MFSEEYFCTNAVHGEHSSLSFAIICIWCIPTIWFFFTPQNSTSWFSSPQDKTSLNSYSGEHTVEQSCGGWRTLRKFIICQNLQLAAAFSAEQRWRQMIRSISKNSNKFNNTFEFKMNYPKHLMLLFDYPKNCHEF